VPVLDHAATVKKNSSSKGGLSNYLANHGIFKNNSSRVAKKPDFI
jgi:hypothetical protein